MLGHSEADPPLETIEGVLEAGVLEGLNPAADLADRMMVVLAARLDPLVARHSAADIQPVHEPKLRQLLEDPINARSADSRPGRSKALFDLERRHRAVLPRQQLDHREPGSAPLVTRLPERAQGVLDPGPLAGSTSGSASPRGAHASSTSNEARPLLAAIAASR